MIVVARPPSRALGFDQRREIEHSRTDAERGDPFRMLAHCHLRSAAAATAVWRGVIYKSIYFLDVFQLSRYNSELTVLGDSYGLLGSESLAKSRAIAGALGSVRQF